ncbi:MAG: beta-ketoacyl-[acyl-carrier-protein] synthase family protein [Verrucomicrobiales bacterium]|nr:beta-ketoacyl-[acyl-carrier-protein] synthase family protein [Verrucomicrobiales bacterium]
MLLPPHQRLASRHRVVITGAGVVSALGLGWHANAEGFRTGRIATRPVTLFDTSRQRTSLAAEVDLPSHAPTGHLSERAIRRLNRASRLLLWAAAEAWHQASWKAEAPTPIILGTTSCGMDCGEAFFRAAMPPQAAKHRQATRSLGYQGQRQALDLAELLGIRGPVTLIANACASGANAIGHAWELLRSGSCTRAVTGGYDALSQLVFAGFDSLQALSTTSCRPFDATRDGLALGEGAAVFCLETLDSANLRGAEVLAEIVGYGAATDAHHLTQPQPEGDAALEAMQEACRVAGLSPGDIHYLNAHGTGTPLNDAAEAKAIHRWAGAHAPRIPVSSTKASIGHLLGAAGAVEALVCLMALRGQWLPPQTDIRLLDPLCTFPVVRQPTHAALEFALTNSFGFGGSNASLILRRWP